MRTARPPHWSIPLLVSSMVFASSAGVGLVESSPPAGSSTPAPSPQRAAWGAPMRIVVSIPPLKGLVESVAPPGSTVETLVPPGASEHGFEVPPSKLNDVLKADLVVFVGLGLEPQLEKFLAERPAQTASDGSRGRRTRRDICFARVAGVNEQAAQDHNHDGHDHAPGEECDHAAANDPHLWLDPVLVRALLKELGRIVAADQTDEASKAAARRELAHTLGRLDELNERYRRAVAWAERKTVVVAHDAFGRLAARFGFKTVAVRGLNADEPSPKALQAAMQAVKEHKLPAVFVEPQLSSDAVNRIAKATGVSVRTLDPLGDGDWFKMMEANLNALESVLGKRY